MSDRVDFQTQIKSLKVLRSALALMNVDLIKAQTLKKDEKLVLQENISIRRYGSEKENCEWGIKLPGNYDLGFNKDKVTGFYSMVADKELTEPKHDYGGRGTKGRKIVGEQGGTILQYYFLAKTQNDAMGVPIHRYFDGTDLVIDVEVGAR